MLNESESMVNASIEWTFPTPRLTKIEPHLFFKKIKKIHALEICGLLKGKEKTLVLILPHN